MLGAADLAQKTAEMPGWVRAWLSDNEDVKEMKNKVTDLRKFVAKIKKATDAAQKEAKKNAKKLAKGKAAPKFQSKSCAQASSASAAQSSAPDSSKGWISHTSLKMGDGIGQEMTELFVADNMTDENCLWNVKEDILCKKDLPSAAVVIPEARGTAAKNSIVALDYYDSQKKWVQAQASKSKDDEIMSHYMITKGSVAQKVMSIMAGLLPEIKNLGLQTPESPALRDLLAPMFLHAPPASWKFYSNSEYGLPCLYFVLEGTLAITGVKAPEEISDEADSIYAALEDMTNKEWKAMYNTESGWTTFLVPGKACLIPSGHLFQLTSMEDRAIAVKLILTSEEAARKGIEFLRPWTRDMGKDQNSRKMLQFLEKSLDIVPLPGQ